MCHVIKFISLTKLSPDLIKAFLSDATSNCIAFQAEDFGFVFCVYNCSLVVSKQKPEFIHHLQEAVFVTQNSFVNKILHNFLGIR